MTLLALFLRREDGEMSLSSVAMTAGVFIIATALAMDSGAVSRILISIGHAF